MELPTTRAEAKATGSKKYFTGKPCKWGHVAARYTAGMCVVCSVANNAAPAARARRAAYIKTYYKNNPEALRRKLERAARYRSTLDKDEVKAYLRKHHLLCKYGMTVEDYERRVEEQGGVCAICRQENRDGRLLCVDHDHSCCAGAKTCGKCVRGLLCVVCNWLLGHAGDRSERLYSAVAYLEKHARGK